MHAAVRNGRFQRAGRPLRPIKADTAPKFGHTFAARGSGWIMCLRRHRKVNCCVLQSGVLGQGRQGEDYAMCMQQVAPAYCVQACTGVRTTHLLAGSGTAVGDRCERPTTGDFSRPDLLVVPRTIGTVRGGSRRRERVVLCITRSAVETVDEDEVADLSKRPGQQHLVHTASRKGP